MDPGSMIMSILLIAITMFCIVLGMKSKEGFIFLIFAVLCSVVLCLVNWMLGLLLLCLSALLLLGNVLSGARV